MNIVSLLTVAISLSYTLSYFFILDHFMVGLINSAFTIAYAGSLLLNKYHAVKAAKFWFFSVLMVHLIICTNLYVTNASGFHLYYFLVPTGAFLLFELEEKFEKILLSTIALVLFFYCENTLNTNPLIVLSEQMNHTIYQSVIFFNMVEVVIVLSIFSSKIEQNEAQLTKQATTDALTGIANRHHFFLQGERLLNQAKEEDRHLTIALIDFDHFKAINDNYGHAAGDICLQQVTARIASALRDNDLFARIGGEEFAIILPDTTAREANSLIDSIRIQISQTSIQLEEEIGIKCTVSAGICAKEQTTESIKPLMIHADAALYQAKVDGRNRVQQYLQ